MKNLKIISSNFAGYPRAYWRAFRAGTENTLPAYSILSIKLSGKGSRRLYFNPAKDSLSRFVYFNHCGKRVYVTFRAYNVLWNRAKVNGWR